jgi:hypothetical protein
VTAADITTMPLTAYEETEFANCVGTIHNALRMMKTSYDVIGDELRTISERKLYRATHATFEAFTEQEFGFSRAHGYRMIDAANVAKALSPTGDKPNERQARELVGLEDAEVVEIWSATKEATGGKPTAQAVARARERIAPKPVQTKIPSVPRRRPLPDQFRSAAYDLGKVAERITRLSRDDRFGSHAAGLSFYRNDLIRARDALQAAIDLIPEPEPWVPGTTVLSPDQLTITHNHNSAFVQNTSVVREALQRLGIQSAAGGKGQRTFPVSKLDAVVKALQNSGIDAHVVRDEAVPDE